MMVPLFTILMIGVLGSLLSLAYRTHVVHLMLLLFAILT